MQSSIPVRTAKLHHTSVRIVWLFLLLALLLLFVPIPGRTQDTVAESNTDDSDVYIEEIVVTAQRRERPLQDVPISITVFKNS